MMKTNTQLQTFLWSVLSLGLLPCLRLCPLMPSDVLEKTKVGRSQ